MSVLFELEVANVARPSRQVSSGLHLQLRTAILEGRLKPGALDEVAVWIGRLRNMWSESFDRLDEFLKSEDQSG